MWHVRYPSRKSHVRRQRAIPPTIPFPCQDAVSWGRSSQRPTSVHRLRPGDIDVVAAIGDSLVAGSGALEEFALGAFVEYRGVSWCAGGDATWREYLTLPNILKEFNPNLRGYSTGTGEWLTKNAKFNVAFPVASDEDAFKQAKIIVARMRSSPEIDMMNDWKMVTIFIGANDLCSASCLNPVSWSPSAHAKKLARAIDYLQKHLPRTIVNLVPVLDVSVSIRVLRPMMCRVMHSFFCSCFHRGGGELRDLVRMARLYQKAELQLIIVARMRSSPEIDMMNDWKMVTIFIGANDLCSASCLNPVSWSPSAHAKKLARAIDYLQKHLPRTIVNLVPVLDVSVSIRVLRPMMCRVMHSFFCSCFHRGGGELRDLVRMARLYQKAELQLVESGRYDTKDDFTVVIQPFMQLFNAPIPQIQPLPLVIHQSYITHDCFHFSQKGHALAANLLWNNLLEPVGNKTDNAPPVLLNSFKCPTRQAPYIFTYKNSRSYLRTGKQDYADDIFL
ncbi:unnamed protein product [Arctia plantaginis]|uniref:Phospholipase B1, membrane-associated n=1 Tax=Arctia plantaginis TaxID=874455 RepID=A0A8S0YXP1_ARCPL|nr:unnamed protein product [Arctia plantaginis]